MVAKKSRASVGEVGSSVLPSVVWMIVAQSVLLDKETDTHSFVNVIESLVLPKDEFGSEDSANSATLNPPIVAHILLDWVWPSKAERRAAKPALIWCTPLGNRFLSEMDSIGEMPKEKDEIRSRIEVRIPSLPIDVPGMYTLEFLLGEKVLHRYPIVVNKRSRVSVAKTSKTKAKTSSSGPAGRKRTSKVANSAK